MKKAKTDPTAPTAVGQEFQLSDLVDELHDRVGEAGALVAAVSTIASTTEVTATSLGRLRHVILTAEAALVEVAEVAAELRELVKS
jgi:hypothetical protein